MERIDSFISSRDAHSNKRKILETSNGRDVLSGIKMMQSSLHHPPHRQLSTDSSRGTATADTTAQGEVGPSADRISNRTSLLSSSLLPITNLGTTTSRVNYQYDPVRAQGYEMPLEPHHHVTYMHQGYTQSLPTSNISKYNNSRPTDNTMAILSSEQYDDRGASRRSVRRQQEPMIPLFGLVEEQEKEEMSVRKTNQVHKSHDSGNGLGERRKKKQKLSSEDEGEEDAAKKVRGRPRMDTKDETAADRRRTQIRLAQRAYRHRKETTIASLEKQVNELKTVNEQMSNIFIKLQDFAVERGMLQREPEFASRLKSATERFLALAKSVDENSKDEDGVSIDGSKLSQSDADLDRVNFPAESKQSTSQANNLPAVEPSAWGYQVTKESTQPTSQATQPNNLPAMEPSVWGYQVTREDNHSNQMNQIDWNRQSYIGPSRQAHQIISRATSENASFGFDLFENDNLQLYHVEIPDNDYERLTTIQETLPLTKTLSHHETTFARHLQRRAIENGFKLITAENANTKRINEVFGFCLRFETRDDIISRLERALEANSKDSLYEWRAPFLRLGGSGTYYHRDKILDGPMVPKFNTGMSMGPFSPAVIDTRETAMFDDFRINMPGFEGEFFDSNDVEGYLRGRGIDIPPNAEFVTVDLDQLSIHDVSSPQSLCDSNTKSCSPETPKSPEARFTELNEEINLISQIDDFAMNISNDDINMNFSLPFLDWNNQNQTKTAGNSFDLTGPIFNSSSIRQNPLDILIDQNPYQERNLVTISVTVLINELLCKVTCLGRAPGFRPMDVESALRHAIMKAF